MLRRTVVVLLVMVALLSAREVVAQTSAAAQAYFQKIGLSAEQVNSIKGGQAVATSLNTRNGDEMFIFGAIFVNAAPETYLNFAENYDRLRKLDEYIAIQRFSTPPTLANLEGFEFGAEDIKALKDCEPGDCDIQMPGMTMGELRARINWSDPKAASKANQFLQQRAIQRLRQYQKQGTISGPVYNDKKEPTDSVKEFKYLLSYNLMPDGLQSFYNYVVSYPKGAPAGSKTWFYWANVKFGLKPTLRLLQVVQMQQKSPAYVLGEKQLYASHYFSTALDLTLLYRSEDPKKPGFFLVKLLGSEQDGLTGFKGSIVRKVAVDKSVAGLQKTLTSIKSELEQK
jgi:hypothetical protein